MKTLSSRAVAFGIVASLVLLCGTVRAGAQSVLFSQPFNHPNTVSSTSSNVDLPRQAADNFVVSADGAVTRVRWWGFQVDAGTTFLIRFFTDEFGLPAAAPFYEEVVTPTAQDSTTSFIKVFTADLSSVVQLTAGTTYYLSVVETVHDNNPFDEGWFWALANASGSDSAFWRRLTDSDPWMAQSFDTNKLAFELLGIPGGPDLSIDIAATPEPVRRSQNLTYLMHVKNWGPGTAVFVILEDVLPPGTTFQSVTTSQGMAFAPAVGSNGTLLVDLGNLASGAIATVTLVVNVNARGGTTISNSVEVSSSLEDPFPSNNSATIETAVFGSRK